MADSFVDEVISAPQGRAPQSAPVEIVESDGGRAKPTAAPVAEPAAREDVPASDGRVLPASVREKFAAMSAARAAESSVDDDDPDAPAGESPAAAADPDAPPGEAKPAAPAAAAQADPVAQLRADLAAREHANRALYEENESLKKRPAGEFTGADKLLQEAARGYLDNEKDALRKFIAAGLGVEDPKAPEVDAELRDLYADLTASELGVTPDVAHQAKREAARTRRQWEREKRERKAQEQSSSTAPAQDAQAKEDADAATFIGTKLAPKTADYPLLHSLSKKLDGLAPEMLLAKVIRRECRTGRLDPKASDEDLIASAAKIQESHYQALRDMFAEASPSPNPSTATPNGKPSAAASSARPDTRQSHGARTLTAADASVAPATPPAGKPAKKDAERPPPGSSPEVVQRWAMRHLRKK